MGKKLFLALCGTTALCMTACDTADEELQASTSPVTAEITGQIGASTRVVDTNWESGDQIGLFVTNKSDGAYYTDAHVNCCFVTTGGDGVFTAAQTADVVNYPSSGAALSFQAYSPYSSSLSGTGYVIDSWADQTSKELDLILSDKRDGSMKEGEQEVALTFKHQFCKLVFNIAADTEQSLLKDTDLEGMTITAEGMNVKASVDVLTGVLTTTDAVSTPITFVTEDTGTLATAIVCPGYNENTENRKVTFTLTNGRKFVWTIPASNKLEKGNRYTWSITLVGDVVVAKLTSTIEDWTTKDMGNEQIKIDAQ